MNESESIIDALAESDPFIDDPEMSDRKCCHHCWAIYNVVTRNAPHRDTCVWLRACIASPKGRLANGQWCGAPNPRSAKWPCSLFPGHDGPHREPNGDEWEARPSEGGPIPMLLWCPMCHERHIDEGEFAAKSHTSHACQHCGAVWRPAIVPTVGVQFLPGFKNEVSR